MRMKTMRTVTLVTPYLSAAACAVRATFAAPRSQHWPAATRATSKPARADWQWVGTEAAAAALHEAGPDEALCCIWDTIDGDDEHSAMVAALTAVADAWAEAMPAEPPQLVGAPVRQVGRKERRQVERAHRDACRHRPRRGRA